MTALEKQYVSWADVEAGSLRLAGMIQDHCQKTGEIFEKMLVILRGGYYPAGISATASRVRRQLDAPAA